MHIYSLFDFQCLHREELFMTVLNDTKRKNSLNTIDSETLNWACPALLYGMVVGGCVQEEAAHLHLQEPVLPEYNHVSVWFYSNLAVMVISACGILGLAVIPIMQKRFYHSLLQFLVALAVGTLAGDALLHLLPHAMSNHDHNDHPHVHTHEVVDHDKNMWKGFVAMLGLIFFFLMERIIMLGAKWRKKMQLKKKVWDYSMFL